MDRLLKKTVWLIAGVIFAYIAAASAATGCFWPDCFYDTGEVDEIYPFTLDIGWNGTVYHGGEDTYFTVTEDTVAKTLLITKKKWNYAILNIEYLNTPSLTMELIACDTEWNAKKAQTVEVKQGKNIFEYDLPKCKNFMIRILGQKGTEFHMIGLQFREKLFSSDKKAMAEAAILAVLVYIAVSAGYLWLRRKKRIDILKPLKREVLDVFDAYLKLIHRVSVLIYDKAGFLFKHTNRSIKSLLRIASLAAWLLASIFLRGYGLRGKAMPVHYVAAIVTLIIFTFTSLEQPPKELPWKNGLVKAWVLTGVIMLLSECIVPKRWPLIGLMFLSVYTVWFWIWGSMKEPEIILADMSWAVKLVFWIITMISIFGRTYIAALPYSGIYKNQNVFAAFVNLVLAIHLAQIDRITRKKGCWNCQNVALMAELCVILFFLLRTESRGGILTGAVAVSLYFFKNRKRLLFLLQLLLLFLPIAIGMEWMFTHIQGGFPYRFEYPVTAQADDTILDEGYSTGETVYAGERADSLMVSLDNFTSGRINLWKAYIRKFNLWGHYSREKVNGVSMHSHNAFTYMIYLYGILVLIPYIIMWWGIFKCAVGYSRKETEYRFLLLAIAVVFFLQAMLDTLEEPFSMENWSVMYLVIGRLFTEKEWGREDEKGLEHL